MKCLRIVNSDKTLFTFNKSGSTLLMTAFKGLCNHKDIEIDDRCGRGNVVVITRNPIHRFYGGYSHFRNWSGLPLEVNRNNRDEIINGIGRYFEELKNRRGIFEWDPHYVPQSQILKEIGVDESNIIHYQLEWLSEQIEESMRWEKPSSVPNLNSTHPLLNPIHLGNRLKIFSDLGIRLEGRDGDIFGGYWWMSKENLREHHKGVSPAYEYIVKRFRRNLSREIGEYFKEESQKWGYPNEESII